MSTSQDGPDRRRKERRTKIIFFILVGVFIGIVLTLAYEHLVKVPPGDPPPTVTAPAEARP